MTILTGEYEAEHPEEDEIRADIQGWVVRGYKHPFVRHVIVEVVDAAAARRFLKAITGGNPDLIQVNSGAEWPDGRPAAVLNIGITHEGLRALGVGEDHLDSFPNDFQRGPVKQAAKLGDVGTSDPRYWYRGFTEPDRLHAMLTVHGKKLKNLDKTVAGLLDAASPGLNVLTTIDGEAHEEGRVHFGYKDGIAQPRLDGFPGADDRDDRQREAPLGEFVLGHQSQFEDVEFRVPSPRALGHNGTFNAFRVLEQHVVEFEEFLDRAAASDPRLGNDRELVAAKLMGRWRNGNPLIEDHAFEAGEKIHPDDLNDYDYRNDRRGTLCPMGSHTRRANPRDTPVVQKGFGHTRRIIRRGMPYGSEYDHGDVDADRNEKRGLLGNFLCASLTAQFENIMYDWVNLGLHHPSITGTNDPILGDNDPQTSEFRIPMAEGDDIVLRGFGRFVDTRGSAYLFMPSLTALRWLGDGADSAR